MVVVATIGWALGPAVTLDFVTLVMGTSGGALGLAGLSVTALGRGTVVSLSEWLGVVSGVNQFPSPMLESLVLSLCRLSDGPRSVDRGRLLALRALEE